MIGDHISGDEGMGDRLNLEGLRENRRIGLRKVK